MNIKSPLSLSLALIIKVRSVTPGIGHGELECNFYSHRMRSWLQSVVPNLVWH